jgi:hypothetical protein
VIFGPRLVFRNILKNNFYLVTILTRHRLRAQVMFISFVTNQQQVGVHQTSVIMEANNVFAPPATVGPTAA